jgi:hypothetical protein
LALLGGCTQPATEVLLTLNSDITTIDRVAVSTWAARDPTQRNESPCYCVGPSCPKAHDFPLTLGLVPSGNVQERFYVEVRGYGPGADTACGTLLISQAVSLQFAPQTTLELYMELGSRCEGVVCPDLQTCSDGACISSFIMPTPVPHPGADLGGGTLSLLTDGGTSDDAAPSDLDASSGTDDAGYTPPCGTTCFVAGTLVRVGATRVPIQSLAKDGEIASLDAEALYSAAAPHSSRIAATASHFASEVLDLYVGGEVVSATGEHPFAVWGAGFVRADRLWAGAPLRRADGGVARLERIETRTGAFPVYNLEVEGDHTYLVSPLDLVVHNKPLILCTAF